MTNQSPSELFEAERPRLVGIAYRMLGTPDDADDVVQDAWLRFADNADRVDNPAAWLTTVVSRLALDRLRSAQSRRETYVGPWLADPVLDLPDEGLAPDDSMILAESLSLGFLAVMERLTPLERAVFILHDVFALPFAEVAVIIERSESAARQLGRRARQHVDDGRPRFDAEPSDVEALSELVLAAAINGDLEQLESFLAEDVIHISDGGADHRAARAPVVGPKRVARFFGGLAKRGDDGMEFHSVRANGQSAMYLTQHGEPYFLLVSNWVDGKMAASFAVRNPDKLASFHKAWLAR